MDLITDFDCPLCQLSGSSLSIGATSLENHFKTYHGVSSIDVWNALHDGPRVCECGCGAQTKWLGWNKGYSKFKTGHNTSETLQRQQQGTCSTTSWCKGLTKENDERVAERARKTSDGMRRAYATGTRSSWSTGLTAAEDNRLANVATKLSQAPRKKTSVETIDFEELLQKNTNIRLEHIDSDSTHTQLVWVRCSTCKWFERVHVNFASRDVCPYCVDAASEFKNDVAAWLRSIGVVVAKDVRGVIGRKLIDLYVMSGKLAIETNQLSWHNAESGKPQGHVQHKASYAQKLGVRFLQFFDDEWRDKKHVVQALILRALERHKDIVVADECDTVLLDRTTRKKFFDDNHIDGDVNTAIAWGLKHKEDIVAALSVKKSGDNLKVLRSCCAGELLVKNWSDVLRDRARQYARKQGCNKIITVFDPRYELAPAECTNGTMRWWYTDGERRSLIAPKTDVRMVKVYGMTDLVSIEMLDLL